MKLYADRPDRVLRQLIGDLAVVILGYLAIRLGRATHSRIAELAGPGREAEATARQLDGQLRDTAGDLNDTPLVGGALSTPFKALASTSRDLAQQAQDYQDAVERFATLAGFLVAGFILLILVLAWLPRRVAWIVEASAASRLVRAYAGQRRPARRARAGPAAAAPAGPARSRGRRRLEGRRPARRRSGWPGSSSTSSACGPTDAGLLTAAGRALRPRRVSRPQGVPAGVPRGCRGEDPADGGRVVQPPGQHQVTRLREGHPGRHHAALLVLALVPLGLRDVVQPAGQVAAERLGAAARGVVVVDQHVPLVRDQVGLLGELALHREQRVLPRHVEQPGGRLPQVGAHRVPVLPEQQHPVLVVEHDHPDGPGVVDDLAGDRLAVRQLDLVAADVPDHAVVHRLAGPHPQRGLLVGDLRRLLPRHAVAAGTGCRLPATTPWRASAAATRPANSGCARVGRDRNSGCAWVATKYGCTSRGSSTYSTRRPSGEVPEKTRPACSSCSR